MGDSEVLKKRAEEVRSLIPGNSIYFAHPVSYYMGSALNMHGDKEEELIQVIEKEFPCYSVFNPNGELHQENYKLWGEETGRGMNYYFDVVLPEMRAGIGLPFRDDMFGAGVAGELEAFISDGRPTFEITESGVIYPINEIDSSRILSVEETRERVYGGK